MTFREAFYQAKFHPDLKGIVQKVYADVTSDANYALSQIGQTMGTTAWTPERVIIATILKLGTPYIDLKEKCTLFDAGKTKINDVVKYFKTNSDTYEFPIRFLSGKDAESFFEYHEPSEMAFLLDVVRDRITNIYGDYHMLPAIIRQIDSWKHL